MKISRDLNLVFHLNDEEGNALIVHSTPLPTAIIETNWKLFREAFDEMSSSKSIASSAVLAKRIFLDAGETLGRLNEARDIIATIEGATYIYSSKPEILSKAKVSQDVKDEVLSKILFFTVYRRHVFASDLKEWTLKILPALSLELSSSAATEVWPSSTTLTTEEPTGKLDTSLPI